MKITLVNRIDDGNYAKNYARTIYQSLSILCAVSFGPLSRAFSNRCVPDENAKRICVDGRTKRLEILDRNVSYISEIVATG